MLNTMTPETTKDTRYMVTRPLAEDDSPEHGPWVLVAETDAGRESEYLWQQVHEAVKSRHTRIVTFATTHLATKAVANGVERWGLGFLPTAPRTVEVTMTTHHEYKSFDVVEVFDAVGAP